MWRTATSDGGENEFGNTDLGYQPEPEREPVCGLNASPTPMLVRPKLPSGHPALFQPIRFKDSSGLPLNSVSLRVVGSIGREATDEVKGQPC